MLSGPWRVAEVAAVAIWAVGGPHHLFPVPGLPTACAALFQGGRILAETNCDGQRAWCQWVRETRGTIAALQGWAGVAAVASVIAGVPPAAVQQIFSVLGQLDAALAASPCATMTEDEETTMEEEEASGLGALIPAWNPTAAPPGYSALNPLQGTTHKYISAYRAAIRATQAVTPLIDARPWLLHQLPLDLAVVSREADAVGALAASGQPRLRNYLRGIVNAEQALENYLESAQSSRPGPWSLENADKLFRQRGVMLDVPVGLPSAPPSTTPSGGGSGALLGLGAAAVVAGLLFSK